MTKRLKPNRRIRLVMIGPPGSGKGTLGRELTDRHTDIERVVTGDYFRATITQSTSKVNQVLSGCMDAGRLLPDKFVISHIEALATKGLFDGDFLLDGFPRTLSQARAFTKLLAARHVPPLMQAVWLEVPERELLSRVTQRRSCSACGAVYNLRTHPPKVTGTCDKCGKPLIMRNDDQVKVFHMRLAQYRSHAPALRSYYEAQGILYRLRPATEDVQHNFSTMLRLLALC